MMRTRSCWNLLAGLLIVAATHAEEPTTLPTESAEARAVAQITCARGTLELNSDVVGAVLRSTAVLQAAAKEVPGLPPGWERNMTVNVNAISPTSVNDSVVTVVVEISVCSELVPASVVNERAKQVQGLLTGLTRELQQFLRNADERALRRLSEEVDRTTHARDEAQKYFEELQSRRRDLLKDAGRADLDRERIATEQRELESRLRDPDVRLVALRARQTALTEQIARLTKEVADRAEHDAVVLELAKVVQYREQAGERMRDLQKSGRVPQADVDKLDEQLAQARADVARQRQFAAQAVGGEMLADLNKELVLQAVNVSEAEAERGALAERLKEMVDRKWLNFAELYEREVQMPLPLAREAVEDAIRRYTQAREAQQRYRGAEVTILGAGKKE
jgi:hypothetical protein